MPLHVWIVILDDSERAFATLDAATAYLKNNYSAAIRATSIESRLVEPEEFVRLTEDLQ